MNTVIMDMSGNYHMLYEHFNETRKSDFMYFDFTSLQGTNIMLDPLAYSQIAAAIADINPLGIHFLDSGNYHYLSYLWMEKIERDFSLLLFDNHPDTTSPMEDGLLECGSWVKEACNNLRHLSQVYILGASHAHILESAPLPAKVKIISDVSEIPGDSSLYISIDKDVLSSDYAATDWDQGTMSLNGLLTQLHKSKTHDILGLDICGEKKSNPSFHELELNHRTNLALLEFFC